jgi:hypothetical protein
VIGSGKEPQPQGTARGRSAIDSPRPGARGRALDGVTEPRGAGRATTRVGEPEPRPTRRPSTTGAGGKDDGVIRPGRRGRPDEHTEGDGQLPEATVDGTEAWEVDTGVPPVVRPPILHDHTTEPSGPHVGRRTTGRGRQQ